MKILVVHNAYQQRGGEDTVVEAEVALLRAHGHEVVRYGRDNHELASLGRATAAASTVWSTQTTADMARLLQHNKPHIVHVHNTFPLVSPSIYWAADNAGVPVVQTLHNFRLLCPQAMLLREGKVCELCVGKAPLPAIQHGCYRGSRPQTALLAGMLMLHRGLGTWSSKVTRYIALNEFCRAKFIEGGLPAERIVVKPNFVDLTPPPLNDRSGFLFVGRLSPEKGVRTLSSAVSTLTSCDVLIVGEGPEKVAIEREKVTGLTFLGAMPPEGVYAQMRNAIALVVPSIWYETFGLVAVEAFACGTPVIASRIGVIPDLVVDGVTGLLFEAGNHIDLAEKMRWALANPVRMSEMGLNAHAHYEAHYTGLRNYDQLIAIYRNAIGQPTAAN